MSTEQGQAGAAGAALTVFSWNLGQLLRTTRVRAEALFRYIEGVHADVLCLQEYPDAHVTLDQLQHAANASRIIPAGNGRHGLTNDTVILSRLPVLEQGDVVHGPDLATHLVHRASSWTTLAVGDRRLRVYNCHFEISGIGIQERRDMLARVCAHADATQLPTIICGDMNTTIPRAGFGRLLARLVHRIPARKCVVDGAVVREDERVGFAALAQHYGFREVLPLWRPTWVVPRTRWEFPKLKLDWFFVRGLEAAPLDDGPYITDHRPHTVRCWV